MLDCTINIENKEIYQKIENLCKEKGLLLYLVKFGSHLYGTDSEHSDTDYKGIFLPSIENLILEKEYKHISLHTNNQNKKNSANDIDTDLWSIQYWFKLLKLGNINALDMLFSYTNSDAIIYVSPILKNIELFKSPMSYINLKSSKEYIKYVQQQTKKYALSGTRLYLLKHILQHIIDCLNENTISENEQFKVIIPRLKQLFFDEKLCFDKEDRHGARILFVLGSGFHEKIKISEAVKRLADEYEKYGKRAKLAEKNEDIDWKAVSHAMRCILQIKEIANTGHLNFPLKNAKYLKEIKNAMFTWTDCEKSITYELMQAKKLVNSMSLNKDIDEVHEKTILSCYSDFMGRGSF